MSLRQSGEDYLEAILILEGKQGVVRSIDVAHYLNFSKPSVSRAVSNLKRDGFLRMKDDGELVLTELGRQEAEAVYERHTIIASLLTQMGVSEKTAAMDACHIEHVVSEETFTQIKKYYYAKVNETV